MGKFNGLQSTIATADNTSAIALPVNFSGDSDKESCHQGRSRARTSKNGFLGLKLLRGINQQEWQKTAVEMTFWGAVAAAVGAVSQQAMLALPLSLCFGLSAVNRRQWQSLLQQRLAAAAEITVVQQRENRLDAAAISSIQERVLRLEKANLPPQVTQLQQWVADLDDRLDELGDRTQNIDEMQQQLAALKRLASVPAKKGRGRVAIFIDGANLFYAIGELGIRIDYTKLLTFLVGDDTLFRAFYYTGVEAADEKQRGFLLWMRHHGFRVVSKPVLQRPDGSKKANLDVEMGLDIVGLAGEYDTAILVGGDGDLACALHQVSLQGGRIEVLSLRSMTSEALIDIADCYWNLEDVKDKICKI
jgi:uncharacterized LabA/DUF88 family protein